MQINEELLRWKQRILQVYKTYERWIIPLIKFVGLSIGMTVINNAIGSVDMLMNFYVIVGIAVIGAFLPTQYIMIMIMAVISTHLINLNLIIGLVSVVLSICTYILCIRLYPKESILILVMVLAFKLKCEYVLVMLVALFGGLSCIVPLIVGVVTVNLWELLNVTLKGGVLSSDFIAVVEYLLNTVLKSVITNRLMLSTMIIFTMVYLIIYIIRKQSIDYAGYVASVMGGVMNILGFLLAVLFLEIQVNVLILIIMTILSTIICLISEYIVRPADYGRAEVVKFEDESNFYYVKVVPKIFTSSTKTQIQQVYTNISNDNDIETL